MWIKLIVSLVAFGALIQSGLTCPAQCSCGGGTVQCQSRSLASVPTGIPSNTQTLYLFTNQITKLEPGVFDRLTQLIYLSLNTNQLTSVPKGAFDNLKSLTEIYLYNNPWDCECTDIMYLQKWVADHTSIVMRWDGKAVNDPDSVKCSGTNKPVRSITAAETSPEKCPGYVKPTTTTAMPTTTTPEIIPTTEPVTTAVTPKPTSGVKLNCTGIVQRSDRPGDCGNPACHTLMNCANFMSCLCASCAICQKRR